MKIIGLLITFIIPVLLFAQQKEINFSKGKDEMFKGNYNLALYYFNLAINEDSLFIKAYNERGLAKYNLGNHTGALEDYQFVLQNEPENSSAYFGIASTKTLLSDPYGAIADYTKAIEISLKNNDKLYASRAYFMRGSIKKDLGDQKGYIIDLRKASELGDENAKFILELIENIKYSK